METNEDTVRIWTGMDPLQAKYMKQLLLDNEIECFVGHDHEMLPAGGLLYTGLWVAKKDEPRARELLEEAEDTMSEQLDAELPEDETEVSG